MDSQRRDVVEELEALRKVVEELQEERRKRNARRGPMILLAAVTAVTVGTAWAANGNCPNGLPFCFAANAPAIAAEVNTNFAFLREWQEAKTGPLDAGFINTPGLQINGQFITGNTGTGNFHINTLPNQNGKLFLNWHTGNGGVVFGNGAAGQAGAINAAGLLTVNDINVTTAINGRRPQRSYFANCSAANCSVSCGNGGVIRQAWGFHGNNYNNNIGGGWACGSGIEWRGSCIDQTSCTAVTGCGTSSIWIDCW